MPKMKTHSGAKKRFLKKKGKVFAQRTSEKHEQVRRRGGHPKKPLAKGQAKRMGKLLGGRSS
jgi:ribosomal protein L35